ncbi:MAG TPA: site-specific DNA-methyltransferase [Bacteroidota bacterium]|nr:site-specific DNA-methyltransferase [Bacteroidota bacterium]
MKVSGIPAAIGTTNLLIHGENVAALSTLLDRSSVRGRVRLVYIDPPFSTRQDFTIGARRVSTISRSRNERLAYRDTLSGEEYLEFLRHRLVLLRELLADDGSIYVHIDDKVGHYVKILLDDIFGAANFRNDITRIKCNPKNFSRKGFGNIKDRIFFYTKTSRFVWNEPSESMDPDDVARLFPKTDRRGRRYTTTPLHAPGETQRGATGGAWKGIMPPAGRHWRVSPKELSRLDTMRLIEWSRTGNPRKKIYADEIAARGKKVQDVWEMKDPPYPAYPTQKNIDLLKRIIAASSHPGDLVLDCFAGSGTTLVAAEMLGRHWIGIDESSHAVRVVRKRLRELENSAGYVVWSCAGATANAKRRSTASLHLLHRR